MNILSITENLMKTGINHYSKEFQNENTQTQIQIKTSPTEEKIVYKMCDNWQPKTEVTFKQIMQKKMDLLGYELLATPFLIKSLFNFSLEKKVDVKQVCAFIFLTPNQKVMIAFYISGTFNTQILLSQHFENMGL